MTDKELEEFCDQYVELKLKNDNEVLTGKLIYGQSAFVEAPYAIEIMVPNPSLGPPQPSYRGISSAENVEWVRAVEEPLSDDRLED
ncbi:MAG: hypothetical protein JOZ77_11965 [Candidatus Eremiobacteraeota bacterium]|nr:hypothetical protein [Candidatus Eremiobacteraeota bacterium]